MVKLVLWEFFVKPDLEWQEPRRFGADCRGEDIRIRLPSHLLFLAIVSIYFAYRVFTGDPGESTTTTILSAVGLGVMWAYLPLLIAKYQPLPVRIHARGVTSIRVRQAGVLPSYRILRVRFENVARCAVSPVSCNGDDHDAMVLWGHSGEEILKVGLDRKVKKAEVVEKLEKRGVACEMAE